MSQNCKTIFYKTFSENLTCFAIKVSKTFYKLLACFAIKVYKTFYKLLACLSVVDLKLYVKHLFFAIKFIKLFINYLLAYQWLI